MKLFDVGVPKRYYRFPCYMTYKERLFLKEVAKEAGVSPNALIRKGLQCYLYNNGYSKELEIATD